MNDQAKTGGFSMFALWFGAAVSLAEIMTGALLAPLGLTRGITAIIAGHLIGTLILAVVGIIGYKKRKPSLVASRASLGIYGSYAISLFNIIQLIGWTAIMLIQCAGSLQAITSQTWGFDNFPLLVIITGVLVGIWALYINRGISIINNAAVALLLLLTVILLKTVLPGGGTGGISQGEMSFGTALELSIIMPLSWVPLISDYTMSARTGRGSFYGSFFGYFLGSTLMYITGFLTALYTGGSDPIRIMTELNMGISVFLLVVFSTVTTTFLDVYSAVISTQNLRNSLPRKKLILIFTALGTILAIFFPMQEYEGFLYMIGSIFAPVFTVVIIDHFYFRADRSALKWNIPGGAAAALGIAAYYIAGGYDLAVGSTIPAMFITTVSYLTLRGVFRAKTLI